MKLQMEYNIRSGDFFLLNEFGDWTVDEYRRSMSTMATDTRNEPEQPHQQQQQQGEDFPSSTISAADYYSGRSNDESTINMNDSSGTTIKQVVFDDGTADDFATDEVLHAESLDPPMDFFEDRTERDSTRTGSMKRNSRNSRNGFSFSNLFPKLVDNQ